MPRLSGDCPRDRTIAAYLRTVLRDADPPAPMLLSSRASSTAPGSHPAPRLWNRSGKYRKERWSPASEKYALTERANEVATRPGFQPPYHALTITATANTARRLSATLVSKREGMRASVVLSTATP